MKAIVKEKSGYGNVALLDVQEPVCDSDSVKIEIKFTGICGTDLHIYHDTYKSNPPVILGHEFSGIITEVGKNVQRFQLGDKVTALPSTAVTCGSCIHCRTGNYMFCSKRKSLGSGVDGAFTKYVVVREDMVYRIPEHISLEEAALTEPLACAVKAIEELTPIHVGDTVLLSGPGPIGLICLALLVMKGCKVIVAGTTADASRLEIAKELGADVIVNVSEENLHEVIERETEFQGVDVAVECAGAGPSVSSCLRALKKRGAYIQVGIVGKEITIDYDTILFKQLQLVASYAHSIETWERVMNIWKQNKIRLQPIITHKLPLSQWKEAFEICEQKIGGKVLLSYDE
ncbi:zinc-dependent alcohol dehydrogenase [Paenibacillus sp. Soil750]|uniref:zinc-dependent alcohol dehydrogenase n=1 Tax=Paenibacillus sp. Soil750 TaxID=1736398 RepID=UPI0006F24792|nr:zinc-binding dehydrogenase [Paenibacillus sp. Soil750]KRE69655.1 Zn-dependent alcohol dehydrogenase [Paenibacillus sp. Soil750]